MIGSESSRSSDRRWHAYDECLAVRAEDIAFSLTGVGPVPWAELLLNPRRIRGSDFLMRWSQGRWSEGQIQRALARTNKYVPIPYGPSSTAPKNPRKFELYFERLEAAGLAHTKRPDLLVVRYADRRVARELVEELGGVTELPFIPESNRRLRRLLALTVCGIECETSLWVTRQMPDYGIALTPQRRLGGRLGVKKSAKLPTVIVKDEDRARLRKWERDHRIPIHIWHVFYDQAFGLSFKRLEQLIRRHVIDAKVYNYQAPNGANTKKSIYMVPYLYAYELGSIRGTPHLRAASITDKNGHVMPYVRFSGGQLRLCAGAMDLLENLAGTPRRSRRA